MYLATFAVIITCFAGVVLAYVFKREPHEEWEGTHYTYLIRTFWIGMIGIVAAMCSIALVIVEHAAVAVPIILAVVVAVQVVVRTVLSFARALGHDPMPKPSTWLF